MKKNRNFSIVVVYSKKRVEAIDKKEEGGRIIYANPTFFKQIETDVDRVYTDDSNIRTAYERAYVEVLPITEVQAKTVTKKAAKVEAPVEEAEAEDAVEETKQESDSVSLSTIKKQIKKVVESNEKADQVHWRNMTWQEQRSIAFDITDTTEERDVVRKMKKQELLDYLERKIG